MLTLTYLRTDGTLIQEQVEALAAQTTLESAAGSAAFFWLDLADPTAAEGQILGTYFHFHRLEIEDALEDAQHPKLDEYEDHLLLIVHGASAKSDLDDLKTTEVDLFLGEKWLVTHHQGESVAIQAVMSACEHQQQLVARSAAYLAYQIVDRVMDQYNPVLDHLDELISELEDSVFDNPSPAILPRLFALKRSVLTLRRTAIYQRDVFARLARHNSPIIGSETAIYYRDIYDSLVRAVDMAENFRDELVGAMEAYLSQISNRLNEIMKFLTVISTLFIPLNFLTGFFGMNFTHLPGLTSPAAFSIMLATMGGIVLALGWYFHRRRWI